MGDIKTHPTAVPQSSVFLLEPLPSSEKGSIIEHIVAVGVQGPVASLARLLIITRHFHKAFVQ